MTEKRRSYTKQFKIDAVKIVTGQGYNISEAARYKQKLCLGR